MDDNRKIIHIDMDAFYASVEQRDNPSLNGKPVIVGGNPDGRGVVATCSYEARKYGIHSAMPSKTAYKRCPYAIFVRPRFDIYHKVSNQIREVFYRYTDLVEPLSLDEAYLDVTINKMNIKYATDIAKRIKEEIYEEVGLTASAGVSYNKFLAKLASDYQKPSGLTVITKKNKQQFLDSLPINKFFGVGKVTERQLRNLGINNGYDLRMLELQQLEKIFKNRGYTFYQFARGIDYRPVQPHRERKSVGSESTLSINLNIEDEEVVDILDEICQDVANRLRHSAKAGKTVTLKIKYDDFTQITRSVSLEHEISLHEDIRTNIYNLLKNIKSNNKQIRLLGVTVSNLNDIKEVCTNITIFEYIENIENKTSN
ncbi:DNA polymerase IV [Romboutsia lituseburensis]|uniref:DNA polymerase IV n=1 Tax=Romboutsia lituseburensis DSM 797 TaxID=1121325 RepID=A0A1G9SNZ1_9FIRM|nr:DNA polymerase IV [Romboutsia lituseburensis]CEH32989.1 DNA polymerase IV [Romboutsia lituseburensis]SDM37179.1 DNA polymerase-4 [Romboutsia lituseburensis DSM 797]